MSEEYKTSPYRRHRNDLEARYSTRNYDEDDEEGSGPFDIVRTKSAPVDRLRRWRQAALVLNASRRFRYTLDLKKEEERKQLIAKIRTHAQVIRAAVRFQEAGKELNVPVTPKLPPSPARVGDFGLSSEELVSMSREHDISLLQQNGGVKGVAEKLKIVKVQPVKQNHNKTLRKSRSILSEDKHRSPVKLKFRSGKVLDLKPENNTPRRLKFRRTRVNTNTTDGFVLDKKSSTEIGSPRPAKENQNKPSRKSRVLVSEDKHRSPIKLFRTEKLVDPQSDNNSLKKLRFRRAREHRAEDNKSDSRTRILKRAGDKNDASGAELTSRKITLKHQDSQGKRDAQGLLNNVIEETASKLVESRKSKVKALVGAFESVISLQERKPSLRSTS